MSLESGFVEGILHSAREAAYADRSVKVFLQVIRFEDICIDWLTMHAELNRKTDPAPVTAQGAARQE